MTTQLNIVVSAYNPERLALIRQAVLLHDKGAYFHEIGLLQDRPQSSVRNDYHLGKKLEALGWPDLDDLAKMVSPDVVTQQPKRKGRLAYCCLRCDIIREEASLIGGSFANPYADRICDCCWVELLEALARSRVSDVDRKILATLDQDAFGYLMSGLKAEVAIKRKPLGEIKKYRKSRGADPLILAKQRCETCSLFIDRLSEGFYSCGREPWRRFTESPAHHICDGWRE